MCIPFISETSEALGEPTQHLLDVAEKNTKQDNNKALASII